MDDCLLRVETRRRVEVSHGREDDVFELPRLLLELVLSLDATLARIGRRRFAIAGPRYDG